MSEKNNDNIYFIGISIVITIVCCFVFFNGYLAFKNNNTGEVNTYEDIKQYKNQYTIRDGRFSLYSFKYTYNFQVKGNINDFNLRIYIPQNEEEKQYITDLNITPKPDKIIKDKNNTIALYNIPKLSNQTLAYTISGKAKIRTYDLRMAEMLNKNISIESDLSKYLQPEGLINSDDSYVRRIAREMKGNTPKEITQSIYEYLQKTVNYESTINLSAKDTLLNRKGKCSEFSTAMVALLRARNIPARVVTGEVARENEKSHNWVQVYFDKYGWVDFDPTAKPYLYQVFDENKRLIKQTMIYDASAIRIKYITSSINTLKMWDISYSSEDYDATVTEKEHKEIHKISK